MSSEKDRIFLTALKYCLDQKTRTRKDVSELTGIHSGRLSQIVNGKYSTGLKVQEKIANAFGYKLDRFLSLGRDLTESAPNNDSNTNSLEIITSALQTTIETQAKYIAMLENENARLKKILGSVAPPVENQFVPSAMIENALGGELAED